MTFRTSLRRCSVREVFITILQNSQENTITSFVKKETPTQVVFFELCDLLGIILLTEIPNINKDTKY